MSYLAEYISSITADVSYQTYTQSVDSLLYHDLVFNYSLDYFGNTQLTAGVTNITDEEPPFIDPGFNASTDPNTYRVFGMGYFLRVTQSF
jgi:outer membrane receptor protein involved in Fe transport